MLHAEPFKPFAIHIADGGRLLVKHQDFAAMAPNGRHMLIYDRPDDYQVIDVMLVRRVEAGARNGAQHPRQR